MTAVGEKAWATWAVVAAIFAIALGLRIYGMSSRLFDGDEVANWEIAQRVFRLSSVLAGDDVPVLLVTTPLMGYEHPPLSVYAIRLSTVIFGDTRLGARMLHIIAGAAGVVALFFLAGAGCGRSTGIIAALLVGFDRFHIGWSQMCQPQSFLFLLVPLALLTFWTALERHDGRRMLWAGAATGLAYLGKEEAVLLLPTYFIFLLAGPSYRAWFRRKELYGALFLMLAVSSIDAFRLFQTKETPDMDFWYYLNGLMAGGISLAPIKFFLGKLFPIAPEDAVPLLMIGFPYVELVMNLVFGALSLLGVAVSLWHWRDPFVRLMLINFFVVFVFFTFGFTPSELLNPYWHAELALFPAAILLARVLAQLSASTTGLLGVAALLLYFAVDAVGFVLAR